MKREQQNRLMAMILVVGFFLFSGSTAFPQELVKLYEKDNEAQDEAPPRSDFKIPVPSGFVEVADGTIHAATVRGGLFVVQFRGEPTEDQLEKLRVRGVVLHDYLGGLSYWATVEKGGNLSSTKFLRAVLSARPEYKITPRLSSRLEDLQETEKLKVTLVFVPGATYGDVAPLLERLGAKPETSEMLFGQRLIVEIDASKVMELAASDLVTTIEPGPGKKKLFNARTSGINGSTSARNTYGLSGAGVKIGIWDGGTVFKHKDLAKRVTIVEGGTVSSHATHVTGTMISSGKKNKSAKGMAPKASVYSYNFSKGDSATEMAAAIKSKGIVLSNNSWGYIMGWEFGFWYIANPFELLWSWHGSTLFGLYTSESGAYDNLVRNKGLTILFAAGNDRNDIAKGTKYVNNATGKLINGSFSGRDGPYMIVGPTGSAKNVITVGATNGAKGMASFSSWGPTRDGRVKPEVSTPGVSIYSTLPNNKYGYISGTSMATPATTGSIAILLEQWKKIFKSFPSTAIIRALLVATANDVKKPGPDYQYGFGTLNVAAAADLIDYQKSAKSIVEGKAKKNKTVVYKLTLKGNPKKINVCLAWLDAVGKTLVNDLDLKVIDPNGKVYRPWTLNPKKRGLKAKTGVNTIDNIELVTLKKPQNGKWTIEVKATFLGKGALQKFALVVY